MAQEKTEVPRLLLDLGIPYLSPDFLFRRPDHFLVVQLGYLALVGKVQEQTETELQDPAHHLDLLVDFLFLFLVQFQIGDLSEEYLVLDFEVLEQMEMVLQGPVRPCLENPKEAENRVGLLMH